MPVFMELLEASPDRVEPKWSVFDDSVRRLSRFRRCPMKKLLEFYKRRKVL